MVFYSTTATAPANKLIVDDVVGRTRTLTATLQHRPEGGSNLRWQARSSRQLRVVGHDDEATLRVTWSGELTQPPFELRTPGESTTWRLLVEAQVLLDADAPRIANAEDRTVRTRRTVYLDTIPLQGFPPGALLWVGEHHRHRPG